MTNLSKILTPEEAQDLVASNKAEYMDYGSNDKFLLFSGDDIYYLSGREEYSLLKK